MEREPSLHKDLPCGSSTLRSPNLANFCSLENLQSSSLTAAKSAGPLTWYVLAEVSSLPHQYETWINHSRSHFNALIFSFFFAFDSVVSAPTAPRAARYASYFGRSSRHFSRGPTTWPAVRIQPSELTRM